MKRVRMYMIFLLIPLFVLMSGIAAFGADEEEKSGTTIFLLTHYLFCIMGSKP